MRDLKRTTGISRYLAYGIHVGYYEYESQVRKQFEHLNG